MLKFMQGKKVYFVAGATAVYALLGLALGYMESNAVVELLLVAGGMVGFKSALVKIERKK